MPHNVSFTSSNFLIVSISGETTAPLPRNLSTRVVSPNEGFNLRRDHRSLATKRAVKALQVYARFQSQARPPLPCHGKRASHRSSPSSGFNLRRDHRSLATKEEKEYRRCQHCFNLRRDHRSLATLNQSNAASRFAGVSISGETTAPLPQAICASSESRRTRFQSQARPPLPCHSHYCPE